jgi:UDP-glucose 6-dehydrogenase
LDVYHGGYRGFGGYCFPKDASAFMHFVKEKGLKEVHKLLSSMWEFNETLLASQGLTVDDVSKHIDKISIAEKVKAKKNKKISNS